MSGIRGLLLAAGVLAIRHSDWMGDLMPVIGNFTLFDLTLPGTHDSLAYDLCPELDPAQPAWLSWIASLEAAPRLTETQSLGIGEQLDQGVRFLDIRLMLVGEEWRGVHFLATCEPLLGYLYTIRNWLARHPSEILVVWLSEHGETHLTGEDQYPGVSVETKLALWSAIIDIFGALAVPALNVKHLCISELVSMDKRVVFVVSDWEEFTDSSPLALDAAAFLYNDISRDLDLTVSLPFMAQSIRTGVSRRTSLSRFWLMSLAPALDLFHIHGALHSMYLKTQVFGDSLVARQCADAIGVPDMTWCPDSLMEFSRLFNYFAQALVEQALVGRTSSTDADLPHAFYVDALGEGGVIQTDRRTRSERGYAIVDKILIRNVQRVCKLPTTECDSIVAELRRRASLTGPFRLWEDPQHGRVMGWPGVPVEDI